MTVVAATFAVFLTLGCEQQVTFSAKDLGIQASPGPGSGTLNLVTQQQAYLASGNAFATDLRPGAPIDKCPYGGFTIVRAKDANGNGLIDIDEPILEAGTRYSCSDFIVDAVVGAPLEKCPFGGNTLLKGVDSNHSLKLEPSEILETTYFCQQDTGTQTAILIETGVPVGKCAADIGGFTVKKGIDLNRNGELDATEKVLSTQYFCQIKQPTYVTEIVKMGVNTGCELGGIIVKKGLDADGDGKIDAPAAAEVQTFCDQLPVYNEVSVAIDSGAPVAKCGAGVGGFTVTKFVDSNHNSLVDAGENVVSTSYICQTRQPVIATEVVQLEEGAVCPKGGIQVSKGVDANVDGKIDDGAEKTTQVVCNKSATALSVTVTTPPSTPLEPNTDYIIDTAKGASFEATLSDKFTPGQSVSFFGKGAGNWKIRLAKDQVIMAQNTFSQVYPVDLAAGDTFDFSKIAHPVRYGSIYGISKADGKIYSSSNFGSSWTAYSGSSVLADDTYVLMGDNGGIVTYNMKTKELKVSSDKGVSFNAGPAPLPMPSPTPPIVPVLDKAGSVNVKNLRVSPDGKTLSVVLGFPAKIDNNSYTTNVDEFFKSSDAGKTWELLPALSTNSTITYAYGGVVQMKFKTKGGDSIMQATPDTKVIYLQNYTNGDAKADLVCSKDYGATWSGLTLAAPLNAPDTSYWAPNPVLAASQFFLSADGGFALFADSNGTLYKIGTACGAPELIGGQVPSAYKYYQNVSSREEGNTILVSVNERLAVYDKVTSTLKSTGQFVNSFMTDYYSSAGAPEIWNLIDSSHNWPSSDRSSVNVSSAGDLFNAPKGISSLGPLGGFVGWPGYAIKLKYQGDGVFTVESLTGPVPLM